TQATTCPATSAVDVSTASASPVVEDVESEYDDENLQQHLLESETKEEAEEDKVAEYDDYQ
ncbi:unnamed protein product, partial [Effrenium voratum]